MQEKKEEEKEMLNTRRIVGEGKGVEEEASSSSSVSSVLEEITNNGAAAGGGGGGSGGGSWFRKKMMATTTVTSTGGEQQEGQCAAAAAAAAAGPQTKVDEEELLLAGQAAPAAAPHPYDFHVCGPRNLSSPNWKDIICSTWKDPKYKRMVVACFIQSVYLLELDRQEKRSEANGLLAPKWWKPFKYKLAETLVDERDGSIYGAVLEWDRSAALSDLILMRPTGAPRAVLALRGTLLNRPTIRRDLQDDLRFLAWESLRGSVRFAGALEALASAARRFGSANVCVGGHSLGAGFALQVGKELARQGVFVECHLFNPPSVSLAMGLRSIGERAGHLWRRMRAALPSSSSSSATTAVVEKEGKKRRRLWSTEIKKWAPHLYVNSNDYICCYYNDPAAGAAAVAADPREDAGGLSGTGGGGAAKLFVMSKGQQKFLEAHGLEQWWSDDMELQQALHNSKLINRQLRSLYDDDAATPTPPKNR